MTGNRGEVIVSPYQSTTYMLISSDWRHDRDGKYPKTHTIDIVVDGKKIVQSSDLRNIIKSKYIDEYLPNNSHIYKDVQVHWVCGWEYSTSSFAPKSSVASFKCQIWKKSGFTKSDHKDWVMYRWTCEWSNLWKTDICAWISKE